MTLKRGSGLVTWHKECVEGDIRVVKTQLTFVDSESASTAYPSKLQAAFLAGVGD